MPLFHLSRTRHRTPHSKLAQVSDKAKQRHPHTRLPKWSWNLGPTCARRRSEGIEVSSQPTASETSCSSTSSSYTSGSISDATTVKSSASLTSTLATTTVAESESEVKPLHEVETRRHLPKAATTGFASHRRNRPTNGYTNAMAYLDNIPLSVNSYLPPIGSKNRVAPTTPTTPTTPKGIALSPGNNIPAGLYWWQHKGDTSAGNNAGCDPDSVVTNTTLDASDPVSDEPDCHQTTPILGSPETGDDVEETTAIDPQVYAMRMSARNVWDLSREIIQLSCRWVEGVHTLALLERAEQDDPTAYFRTHHQYRAMLKTNQAHLVALKAKIKELGIRLNRVAALRNPHLDECDDYATLCARLLEISDELVYDAGRQSAIEQVAVWRKAEDEAQEQEEWELAMEAKLAQRAGEKGMEEKVSGCVVG